MNFIRNITNGLLLALVANTGHSQSCAQIPSIQPPATAVPVSAYGATPDDFTDDTLAIQRALDAGGDVVFTPGVYLTSRQVRVRRANTRLFGVGATLHATNPESQSINIEADNSGVYGLQFTAVTNTRKTAPWHTRISVYKEVSGVIQVVRNTTIVGNVIAPTVGALAPYGNSSSGGGIILLRAEGFLVANNTVSRTLADGIHVTAGSKDGLVIGNKVRETGDDMIAAVSYALGGPAAFNNAGMLIGIQVLKQTRLVQNVLITDNDVSSNYWGRGISVVGGQDITIQRNKIDNVPTGAGVILAREANYQTFGVQNVLVKDNIVSRIQTHRSAYDPDGTFATRGRSGHGAYEVHASMFEDEVSSVIRSELAVSNIAFTGNTLTSSAVLAARTGVAFKNTVTATRPEDGLTVSRNIVTGDVVNVNFGSTNGVTGSRIVCP